MRERLIGELRSLGLEPQVRERPDCRGMPGSRTVSCSLTRNVVAVIGADRPGKALLLNAHYDSTPAGPGAADDGIGVATLLEVASILRTEPPAQPVILLFNEGEEFGLNGAGAFLDGDPLAGQVGSLINIEARGVSGPAFMFETSEPNGQAIAAFAAATAPPLRQFADRPISPSSSPIIPTSWCSRTAAGQRSTTRSSAMRRATIRPAIRSPR